MLIIHITDEEEKWLDEQLDEMEGIYADEESPDYFDADDIAIAVARFLEKAMLRERK